MKKIIIALLFCSGPVLASVPNLDCKITNKEGKSMTINTYERFGSSVEETPTAFNYQAIDMISKNEIIVSNLYIDKTTLLGRFTAQKNDGKTHTAKADCNY